MPLGLKDALLVQTGNLPNGATSTLTSAINLGIGPHGENAQDRLEWEIDAPALTTGEMGDTHTMTYDVVVSKNSDLSSSVTIYGAVLVQTGAAGAGAAASTARFRLPMQLPLDTTNARTYLGVKATNSSTGNPSAKTFSLSAVA